MNNVRIFQLCKLNCIERGENNLLKVLGSAWLQGLFIRKQSRLIIISIFRLQKLLILASRIKDSFSLRQYLIRYRAMLLTTLQFEK